jgi:hypothetical protein
MTVWVGSAFQGKEFVLIFFDMPGTVKPIHARKAFLEFGYGTQSHSLQMLCKGVSGIFMPAQR